MKFCLTDGTSLLQPTMLPDPNATLRLPQPNVTQPGPTVASPIPSGPQTPPEQMQWTPPAMVSPAAQAQPQRRSALPWLLAIAVVLGLSGIVIALIIAASLSGSSTKDRASASPTPSPRSTMEVIESTPTPNSTPVGSPTPRPSLRPTPYSTPRPTPRPTPYPTPRPSLSPTPERTRPAFSTFNNTSFNGSRITYYPRPSFGLCQSDCAANASCRGFTWIRPGAYNAGDSAMCYLMSAVTAKIPHPCCISAVKN